MELVEVLMDDIPVNPKTSVWRWFQQLVFNHRIALQSFPKIPTTIYFVWSAGPRLRSWLKVLFSISRRLYGMMLPFIQTIVVE
jgi:hypothetical protein